MSYHKPAGEFAGVLAYITYVHFNDFESLFSRPKEHAGSCALYVLLLVLRLASRKYSSEELRWSPPQEFSICFLCYFNGCPTVHLTGYMHDLFPYDISEQS